MAQSAAAHKKHGSHIRLSVGDRLFVVLNYTLLALVMLIVLYPLIYIVSCSFSSPGAIIKSPTEFLPCTHFHPTETPNRKPSTININASR